MKQETMDKLIFDTVEKYQHNIDYGCRQELFNGIRGFMIYWTNFLKDPMSWQFDNGDDSDRGAQAMMLSMMGRKKEYNESTIDMFIKNSVEMIDDRLEIFFENTGNGIDMINSYGNWQLIDFNVDYNPTGKLSIVTRDISEINMNTFPCKTQSNIMISNVVYKNETKTKIEKFKVHAFSAQGYRAQYKKIDQDGILCIIEEQK